MKSISGGSCALDSGVRASTVTESAPEEKGDKLSAYVVSRLTIRDRDAMQGYISEAAATVQAFGGRYLVRGGGVEALEGHWEDDRMVVLEFASKEAALAWYGSEEYRPLRELRQGAAEAVILLADGVDEPGPVTGTRSE